MVRMERPPPSGGMNAPAPSRCGSTQKMSANIKVIVRVRPLNERETDMNNRVVVDVVDESMLVFDPKEEQQPFFYQGVQQSNKNFLKRANKELKFVFDHVCDMNDCNKDVFEITTKDMISSLMEGYNCSVFAYGATGAGKTFTMIGSASQPGITYLTMEHLFNIINSFEKEREFDIGVSYIEVYNENVYDLLKPSNTPLQLREDNKYGVMVAGLTLNSIKTARELLNMLENGNKNRTQHPTDANAESSRSHAVFQVYVKMRYRTSSQLRMVKLSMIDLAGSERASATGCKGDRFKEGANINKSLLSLANCINRLADGSSYIPYRDSKLTRLLKDSLGGNCKTVMIANVSPSSISYEDTYNTLKYAARANKIQLSIKKNIVDGDMRLSQYVKLNEELKKKVKELEAKLSGVKPVVKEVDLNKDKAEEWRKRIVQEEEIVTGAETHLLRLMCQQRVLALRAVLRARAAAHLAALAHRSSVETLEQICSEDIPRQERAAENYTKQSANLDSKVLEAWSKWNESSKKLKTTCEQAVSQCPYVIDFVKTVQLQTDVRQYKARYDLTYKLLSIINNEYSMVTDYSGDMTLMLRKLYLTLKGYDKVPPAMTTEYIEIMRKAKSARGITWSDEVVTDIDSQFKFISNLELDKPLNSNDYGIIMKEVRTVDIETDDDLTDIENREPIKLSAKKRKGTPIKLANNETIIINDSFEMLDSLKKKIKREFDVAPDCENFARLEPKDLNSTFVLADKIEPKKVAKIDVPVKRGLTDQTYAFNKDVKNFNFVDKSKSLKPLVGRAAPVVRAGFGSSLARDGRPLQTNVQVRGRERVQSHPYSRPKPASARK